jgi:serine phosphatase RsbU (regulator of sigma subunit)
VVNDFYQAVAQDISLFEVVMTINQSLCALLPAGRFVSAALVCLDEERRIGEVWVGGVPDVLHIALDGTVLHRYASSKLPLGIVEAMGEDCIPVTMTWDVPSHVLLCSDGVIEASGDDGNEFGYEGIIDALRGVLPDQRLKSLHSRLDDHLQGKPAHDDMSMLLLDLPSDGAPVS